MSIPSPSPFLKVVALLLILLCGIPQLVSWLVTTPIQLLAFGILSVADMGAVQAYFEAAKPLVVDVKSIQERISRMFLDIVFGLRSEEIGG